MNARVKILIAVLLVAAPSAARPKVDVIVMSNGDHITGEIKSLNAGVLRVDLDYVDGSVALQWMKVARIESPQLFIVHTQDGSAYTGTLLTSPAEANKIQVADIQQSMVTIEQSRIVRLDETDHKFLRRWNGELSLGLVYSKGNNSTQNTVGVEVEHRRERWGAAAAFNSNLSSNSGSNTSTRNQIDLSWRSSSALEELLLRRNWQLSTKLGSGDPSPKHHRRRPRPILQEHQPRPHLRPGRPRLAERQLQPGQSRGR